MFSAVPSKIAGDVWTEAMYDTYVRDNLNVGVLRPVAGNVLSVDAASVSFTGISATDLFTGVLVIEARSTAVTTSTNWLMRFNGDTGSNYHYTRVYGRNATVTAASTVAADTSIVGLNIPGASSPAGVFATHVIQFPGLRTGAARQSSWFGASKGANASNNAFAGVNFGRWINTVDAVESITFTPLAGLFATGSKFQLYGMGEAA